MKRSGEKALRAKTLTKKKERRKHCEQRPRACLAGATQRELASARYAAASCSYILRSGDTSVLTDRVRRSHLLGHHQAVGRNVLRRRINGGSAENGPRELVDVDRRYGLGAVAPHTAMELRHAIHPLELRLPQEA